MEVKEYYYSERPWSIIKDFILTYDKNRSTKSAKLIKPYCNRYQMLLEDGDIIPDTGFPFIFFYSMMKWRSHFDYKIILNYDISFFSRKVPNTLSHNVNLFA